MSARTPATNQHTTASSESAVVSEDRGDDFKQTVAIVLDSGSGYTKAGFSGDERPQTMIKSSTGMFIGSRWNTKKSEELDYYIGHNIPRKDLVMKKPITHGIVTDWDALEKLWHHVFYHELQVCPEEHGILVTDPPYTPSTNREKTAEVLFEGFEVPAIYLAPQSVLSIYSYGRLTGLVVDSGSGCTYVSPVYNGYCLPHATSRLDLAGQALNEHLSKLAAEAGHCFSSKEISIVQDMKEKCCYVSEDLGEELRSEEQGYLMDYLLPDGNTITLGSQRFLCPEILFCPSTVGVSQPGMHIMAMNSLKKCATEHQAVMMKNVATCGGSSLLPGFSERLKMEMLKLVPQGSPVAVLSGPHRQFSSWVGGSIITCLSSFQSMWVKKQEYMERGPTIMHSKCY
ncbi:uncharacterized protein [Lepisosteus oculatus]|uniref:uncharacterized protein n=1 Tax=Lepisosteus oculatus TaxID=7918 RepID=UPI003721B4F3